MVGDLLDAARIEGGHLELKRVACDLRRIAADAVELFRPTTDRHELRLDVADSPVIVVGDGLRLEQVLVNLVSNAIKYSPEGGVIEVFVGLEGDRAMVRVADRGLGIAPDEVPHIFEPFRRAGSSRDVVPGVGLGLSVSRHIIEAHAGRIDVESSVGAGTTFRVRLPLAIPEPGSDHVEPATVLH
jgi:signal transduction histidine kinase